MVADYGRHAVWAETSDGKLRLLPRVWTTLQPRPEPLAAHGQAVRLAPEALRELAAWVSARTDRARPDGGKKLASGIGGSEKVRDGEGGAGGGARSAAAVVGETRSPDVGRGVEGRGGGAR